MQEDANAHTHTCCWWQSVLNKHEKPHLCLIGRDRSCQSKQDTHQTEMFKCVCVCLITFKFSDIKLFIHPSIISSSSSRLQPSLRSLFAPRLFTFVSSHWTLAGVSPGFLPAARSPGSGWVGTEWSLPSAGTGRKGEIRQKTNKQINKERWIKSGQFSSVSVSVNPSDAPNYSSDVFDWDLRMLAHWLKGCKHVIIKLHV